MSTNEHTQTTRSVSLHNLARIAGVLYLIIIAGGIFAGYVRSNLYIN